MALCLLACSVGAWNNARFCIMNGDLRHLSSLYFSLTNAEKNLWKHKEKNTCEK